MTVISRKAGAAAEQQLRRLLRGTGASSLWLQDSSSYESCLSPLFDLLTGRSSPPFSCSCSCSSSRLYGSYTTFSRRSPVVGPFNTSCSPFPGGNGSIGSPEVRATGLALQHFRGAKISGSEVKVGFVIERKGRIEKILKAQHTTQGRGGALIQVEVRDVQSGLKSSARLRTSEAIEKVFVDERQYTFLYKEDETIFLMDPVTFEQMEIPKAYFETGAVYLTDGMDVTVQHFDGKPLSAFVPPRVTCTVAEAEPYFKGQAATPSYKRVVLQNGQQIMTPSFISAGDVIIVDTTDNSYVTRSKT